MSQQTIDAQFQDELSELMATGAQVTVKNNGHHWMIVLDQTRIDYWPSSERFQVTFKSKINRGYRQMMKMLVGKKEVKE